MSDYPEHDRQRAVMADAQVIGAFLDETPYILAEYRLMDGWHEERLVPVQKTTLQVLADYFDIDLDKIEAEKRAMLHAHTATDQGQTR